MSAPALPYFPFRTEDSAPKWDGTTVGLDQFFVDVERVCKSCLVAPTAEDLIKKALYYVDLNHHQFWELCKPKPTPGAGPPSWESFKANVWAMYPELLWEKRPAVWKLEALARDFVCNQSPTVEDWGKFIRGFSTISNALIDTGGISEPNRTKILWSAFHQDLRSPITRRLQSLHPTRISGLSFTYDQISETACQVIQALDVILRDHPVDAPNWFNERRELGSW